MKANILAIVLLIGTISLVRGQAYVPSNHGYTFKKANKLYDSYAYQDALEMYQQLIKDHYDKPVVKLQIAECYRHLNDPRKAVYFYKDVVDDPVADPIHKFHFADALFKIGHREKAREWLQRYALEAPDDERVTHMLRAIENYGSFYEDSSLYRVDHLGINSRESDFGPSCFDGGIVFASARKDPSSLTNEKYKRDNSEFLDLYYSRQKADCTMSAVLKFNPRVNSKYHESNTVFFDNERKMLFTRNNYIERKLLKSSTGDVNLKLFQAERGSNGEWINIQSLPFNSDEYSTGHAAISEDGTKLYFVSDRPGGQGGPDLYFSEWMDGSWSDPVNLGDEVNTKGRELFPYLYKEDILYFASDGHYGMGGLDIYQLDLHTGEIINLGYPINTQWDDFAMTLEPKGTSGFFSSNRDGGKGGDDVYKFYQLYFVMEMLVVDQSKENPLPGAMLILTENGKILSESFTDDRGKFKMRIPVGRNFEIKIGKEGFVTLHEGLSTIRRQPGETTEITLKMNKYVQVTGTVYDNSRSHILPSASVSVVNENSVEERVLTTDEKGMFNIKLERGQKYTFIGSKGQQVGMKVGYEPPDAFEDSIQLTLQQDILALNAEQAESIDDKVKTTLLGKGVMITGPIQIQNIYYEFDRWNIVEEATEELDKIVQIMVDNPRLKIELRSHTDARGSRKYNQDLSEKRAQSAMQYMIKSGIDAERITAKGYGESWLLNNCKTVKDCTEEEHRKNRRTEFVVLEF